MQKNFSNSEIPEFKRQSLIDFDTEKFKPTPKSLEIYNELTAISEEIDRCRERNLSDILTA